jgi:hypothetical protein
MYNKLKYIWVWKLSKQIWMHFGVGFLVLLSLWKGSWGFGQQTPKTAYTPTAFVGQWSSIKLELKGGICRKTISVHIIPKTCAVLSMQTQGTAPDPMNSPIVR